MPTSDMPDPTKTWRLADLQGWPQGNWLAVLGRPIQHSLSPAMHNAALAEMARHNPSLQGWRYLRFEVAPEELPRGLELFRAQNFRGLNLTVPHKVEVLPHLRGLAEEAHCMGAANTLLLYGDGYHGRNTDGYGLAQAVREGLGFGLEGRVVILLGAGGAARAAAVQCLQSGVEELWIGNRNQERLAALLGQVESAQKSLGTQVPVKGFAIHEPPENLPQAPLVINATSLGLKADEPAPIELSRLPKPSGVFDMIYNPPLTPLLQQAETLGVPFANGLGMLIWQGTRSLEHWTGQEVPVETMRQAALTALKGGRDA